MRFQVLELAYDVIESLRRPHQAIRARDPRLARQLRDAANSVPLNIEEADGRRGADRQYHFRVALGSAKEVRGALRASRAWGDLPEAAYAEPLALVERVIAILWRLAAG
jgi:four helix bundle protein